jgi:hypothetical protein
MSWRVFSLYFRNLPGNLVNTARLNQKIANSSASQWISQEVPKPPPGAVEELAEFGEAGETGMALRAGTAAGRFFGIELSALSVFTLFCFVFALLLMLIAIIIMWEKTQTGQRLNPPPPPPPQQ